MSNELWEKAIELASRAYNIDFEFDTYSNGDEVIIASNPELPGCKAMGATMIEAVSNLHEVRIDYINALLEEGIPVPNPEGSPLTYTEGLSVSKSEIIYSETDTGSFDNIQNFDIKSDSRASLVKLRPSGDMV